MPWFKVDDGFCFHPKALAAGNSALGLWVRAGSWCGANLTGGALPRHMIGTFGAQKRDAKRLVEAGLWCETEDGYQFNGWNEYQPTKLQVEGERKAARERQARHREAKRHSVSHAVTEPVTNAVSNGTPTRPDPTHSSFGTITPQPSADAPTAQTLLGEWIDHCSEPPPGRVKGQIAKEIKNMLDEGIPYERVRQGLATWQKRGLHPSTLPSIVHELATPQMKGRAAEVVGRTERTLARIAAREAGTLNLEIAP